MYEEDISISRGIIIWIYIIIIVFSLNVAINIRTGWTYLSATSLAELKGHLYIK